jgi:uncharacterized protein (TIGR03032 family)
MSSPTGIASPAIASSATEKVPIHCMSSGTFPVLLQQLGVSLLVSTIGTGRLVVLGTWKGEPAYSFHDFERTLGIAVRPNLVAIGAKSQIWFLRSAPQLTPYLEPRGKYDACFLTRTSHYTGEIHGHELAWAGEELWVVNTLFSCLCTLSPDYSFVPRWLPPFITAMTPHDRCHLNGFVLENGRPCFATMLGETNSPNGWRPNKNSGGCLIDVPSGAVVARGLCMPHSPRLHDGKLWMLESGFGRLSVVETASGRLQEVAMLQGFTRGLDFFGPYAFVGLSFVRPSSGFEGLPISKDQTRLQCGVIVIDIRSGQQVASVIFQSGVIEIFAVQVLPGIRCPAVSGYNPIGDGERPIWLAPDPRRSS